MAAGVRKPLAMKKFCFFCLAMRKCWIVRAAIRWSSSWKNSRSSSFEVLVAQNVGPQPGVTGYMRPSCSKGWQRPPAAISATEGSCITHSYAPLAPLVSVLASLFQQHPSESGSIAQFSAVHSGVKYLQPQLP